MGQKPSSILHFPSSIQSYCFGSIATVSLLIAGLGIGKLVSPLIQDWSEGKELAFGAVVLAVMLASYLTASTLARLSAKAALSRQEQDG